MGYYGNTKTSVEIDLTDLDEDELLDYVRNNYTPKDLFEDLGADDIDEDLLIKWAEENGYVEVSKLPKDIAMLYA